MVDLASFIETRHHAIASTPQRDTCASPNSPTTTQTLSGQWVVCLYTTQYYEYP